MSKIGVVYTSTSENFSRDYFLPQYHLPGVRDMVRFHLERMAEAGVEVINTRVFVGAPEERFEDRKHSWMLRFPPTGQDRMNLRQYVKDVRDAGLTLDLWLQKVGQCQPERGMAVVDDYGDDTPDTAHAQLGWGEYPLAEYRRLLHRTIVDLIGAVEPGDVRLWSYNGDSINHPDPSSVKNDRLRRVLRNNNWVFEAGFGLFAYLLYRDDKGTATLECVTTKPDRGVPPTDPEWQALRDPRFPATEGHRTMWWPARTHAFVLDCFHRNRWPMKRWLAPWLLLDCYVDAGNPVGVRPWVRRIVDDFVATKERLFPHLSDIGFTETSFFGDAAMRKAHAEAMADPRIGTFALWSPNYRPHRLKSGHTPSTPIVQVDEYKSAIGRGEPSRAS